MIQISPRELLMLIASAVTMGATVGAWLVVYNRMRDEVRQLRRAIRDNLVPRLNALDGGRPTTRELPAVVSEDSGG